MADMQISVRRAVQHARRGSPARLSTRIDLTPMVDLGFLLITFFMLTTALAKPRVMPVAMPENVPEANRQPVKSSQVLTLLLVGRDSIYWYEGFDADRLEATNYTAGGLRRVVLNKMSRVAQQWGNERRAGYSGQAKEVSRLTVLIKATSAARYKNVVDVLDEMKICEVARYVLADVSPREQEVLQRR